MLSPSSGDERHSRLTKPLALESMDAPAQLRNGASSASSRTSRPGMLHKNWVLLQKLQKAKLVARQQGYIAPVTPSDPAAELKALQQVARQGEQQKAQSNSYVQVSPDAALTFESFRGHAAPLSPLRERDMKALSDLFQREDIFQIEADIADRLLHLLPEPCWEDDPFDFIREFV